MPIRETQPNRTLVKKRRSVPVHRQKFPQRPPKLTKSQFDKNMNAWSKSVQASNKPAESKLTFRAVEFDRKMLSKIHKIIDSDGNAPREMLKTGTKTESLIGAVYTALVVYQFGLARGEYEKRLKRYGARRTPREKEIYAGHVKQYQKWPLEFARALNDAGLRGVDEKRLMKMWRTLRRHENGFEVIKRIDASERAPKAAQRPPAGARRAIFVTELKPADLIKTPVEIIKLPDNWCPIDIRGTKTWHWGKSATAKTTVSYPCGVGWTNWHPTIKWCSKTITLFTVSIQLNLEIGYEIDCCGFEAWGCGEATACGGALGATACLKCKVCVVGVAGVATSQSGSNCTYGLGLTIKAECTFLGQQFFQASIPYGWNVSGPCPPKGFCD